MTTLYAYTNSEFFVSFDTEDDHPHRSEARPGKPYHLFRVSERAFEESRFVLWAAVENSQAKETRSPDIADYDYDKIEHKGVKMSVFKIDNYFIAATIVTPGQDND